MNKQQFLFELRARLSGLPQEDLEERINFYSEMIDDRTEEGYTEEAAVAEIGTIDETVSQVLADYPLSKIVRERVRPKRSLKAWEIALIILGAPLWLPLLIAAFAVVLSIYIVIWAVVISLWAVDLSLAVSSLGAVAACVMLFVRGEGIIGLGMIGAGFFFAGLTIFLFLGCLAATKGTLLLAKKIFLGIKTMFIGKENVK